MKQLLSGLALVLVACSGTHPDAPPRGGPASATAPTPSVAPERSAETDIPRGSPGESSGAEQTAATSPQFTFTGPQNAAHCFAAGRDLMQWMLTMTDAGPSPLRFVALAHQDLSAGCEATAKNPRARIGVSGTTAYAPHASGQTAFTFDPTMYDCGRVQLDVSIFDATGRETLILGVVIDYGRSCDPPLACAPAFGSAPLSQPYAFRATGGTGQYSWATIPAAGAVPPTGAGATFTQRYAVDGVYVATVRSGDQTASCQVVTQAVLATAR